MVKKYGGAPYVIKCSESFPTSSTSTFGYTMATDPTCAASVAKALARKEIFCNTTKHILPSKFQTSDGTHAVRAYAVRQPARFQKHFWFQLTATRIVPDCILLIKYLLPTHCVALTDFRWRQTDIHKNSSAHNVVIVQSELYIFM